jgi:L-amino acid N-acyltransferase YncA
VSLYGQYILERANKHIIENDNGFAVYSFPDNNTVYIEDIYVIPEKRKSMIASEFANRIATLAKELGKTRMLGSVVPTANNSTISLQVLINYGMKLHSCDKNFIVFEKEL